MSQSIERSSGETGTDKLVGNAVMFDVLKGGYGKSALSLNLADRLADRGNEVLYLDLDPNGHITHSLGYDDVYQDEMHDYGFVVSDQKFYAKFDRAPEELIVNTEFGWDFVPSFDDMESSFEEVLRQSDDGLQLLAREFMLPLFESGKYDYFVMDGGGERSRVADSGFYAGRQCLIPIAPGEESASALRRTQDRIIKPLKQRNIGFEVLAFVPNLLSDRIDYETEDRILLERLNGMQNAPLPSFARITDDEWEKIDKGELKPRPGIRKNASIRKAIGQGMPVAHYDPDCEQIPHFDELAAIVENGGVE